jgi:hypothetical protein
VHRRAPTPIGFAGALSRLADADRNGVFTIYSVVDNKAAII